MQLQTTMPTLDDLWQLARQAKEKGRDQMILCPAHNDTKPSLAVGCGDDGRILLTCQAGCKTENVLNVLRLTFTDLFPKTSKSEVVAAYDYKDASRKLLYQVVRFRPKSFKQRRPGNNGEWLWNMQGVTRILYRLPELITADKSRWVFVVEGENDCNRLSDLGLIATTNVGGAGKWREDYNSYFEGRKVCILPDNDEPGLKHAEQVTKSLIDIAAEVRIVQLDNLPDGGDVSDWLDNGGTIEGLKLLVKETKPLHTKKPELALTCVKDIEPQQLTWFWPNKIPSGALTILAGDPDAGKSYLSLYFTSKVSVGGSFPDCPKTPTEKGSVIIINDEDNPAKIIQPRLSVLKADLEKIHILGGEFFNINLHLAKLESLIEKIGDCRLLIIDPITAYLGTINANSNAEVRSSITPLIDVAEKHNLTIIGINHFNKKQDLKYIYRGLGSTAFTALARSAWGVLRDKDEQETRIFCPIKANYCIEPTGLKFRIIEGVVVFESEPWSGHIDDTGQRNTKRLDDASNWLRERLGKGEVTSDTIFEEGEEQGFNRRLLYRVKQQLGVRASKLGYESDTAQWFWRLPDNEITNE